MKAQISRDSHQRDKDYSGVYQQQGRMLTDADWNELADVLKLRQERALAAVVGSGVPRSGGALRVNDARSEAAGPGRVSFAPALAWGDVVVEGIQARVVPRSGSPSGSFDYSAQRDFPAAPALPAGDHTLYVDVWERLVVAIQDPKLADEALHGADTCVRTEVLAQIKFATDATRVGSAEHNPARGNALFGLRRIDNRVEGGDPCAAENDLAKDLGNYLFRLEVQRVDGTARNPSRVILKWSSENGAEAHAAGTEPVEFKHAEHVFEFFSETTERHLGVHLSNVEPRRSELATGGYPPQIPLDSEGAPFPMVRRWDGYCELERNGTNWSFVRGRHLEHALAPGSGAEFSGAGELSLRIGELSLTLGCANRTFVAGDYWYALLRGHGGPQAQPYVASAEPVGVVHHYLKLLTRSGGAITYPATTEDARRLGFPALTALSADRVGYDPSVVSARWTDVNESGGSAPRTVQDAIDQLIHNLDASDVGYALPGCTGTTSVSGLLSALAGWPDLDGDTRVTLKDMLDALLCRLDAQRIPYLTSSSETVHQAVEARVRDTGDVMTGDLEIRAKLRVAPGTGPESAGARVGVDGGLHVGGTSDPGNDNLLVDGRANVMGGLGVGTADDPGNGNLQVEGNAIIKGGLTVSGALTTVSTSELEVTDRIVRVNKYTPQAPPLPVNGGLEVFRGGSAAHPNAQLIWDELADHWMHGVEGNLRPIGGDGGRIVTGVVRFVNLDIHERISPLIDPGFGREIVCVTLAVENIHLELESGDVYDASARWDRRPYVRSLMHPSGRFRIWARARRSGTETWNVRWWAFKATEEAATVTAEVSVKVEPNSVSVSVGSTLQLDSRVEGTTNTEVTWHSANPQIATVDQAGVIKGVRVGSTTITASSNDDPTREGQAHVSVRGLKSKEVPDDKIRDDDFEKIVRDEKLIRDEGKPLLDEKVPDKLAEKLPPDGDKSFEKPPPDKGLLEEGPGGGFGGGDPLDPRIRPDIGIGREPTAGIGAPLLGDDAALRSPLARSETPLTEARESARDGAEVELARSFIQPHERPDVGKW